MSHQSGDVKEAELYRELVITAKMWAHLRSRLPEMEVVPHTIQVLQTMESVRR